MDVDAARGNSRLVGLITLGTGIALVLSPGRLGGLSGIDDRRTARLIGVADLALVPGLLSGKPRWPWMAARAALNLPMAAVYARSPRTSARLSAAALLALTASDGRVALALHRARS